MNDVERWLREAREGGDPTAWFDLLYAGAAGDTGRVPWARLAPHPSLAGWLDGAEASGRNAVVVGCGLGDDAEALAAAGFEVTAFDVSSRAVVWARERFPDSPVRYVTADLFDPPPSWLAAFDVVWESRTVQSLPPALHATAVVHVAALAAPDARLLATMLLQVGPTSWEGPPWPVDEAALAGLADVGFREVARAELGSSAPGVAEVAFEFVRAGPAGHRVEVS